MSPAIHLASLALQILIHVGRKVMELHEHGWVHRDLKPGNTIWLPSKNSWTLIDFGCASRTGQSAELSFSLWFAPPEVIQAYKADKHELVAEPSADVWSLGVRFDLCPPAPWPYVQGAEFNAITITAFNRLC